MVLELEGKVRRIYYAWRRISSAPSAAAFALLAENNNKRRWIALVVPDSEANSCLICLTYEAPTLVGGNYIQIPLSPSGSLVLSMTGSMPWQGPVYAIGIGGQSGIAGGEMSDYP